MRAEDTLQFMMDFQGSLFHSRQKCLDQLFCTIGNGYSWVDGELVEDSLDTKTLLSRWKLVTPIEHAEPTWGVSELGKMKEDILKRRGIEDRKRISSVIRQNKNAFMKLFSLFYFDLWD